MKPVKTEAIILRRTNYGEADRIINFLTPDHGKLSAIAKGVRKPKSKLAGGLELFALCEVTIMQGKGDVGLVTSARLGEFFGDILYDYDRMQFAYDMIKQINRATETVSEPEFYYLLKEGLKSLNNLKTNWQLVELWFLLHLNMLLGRGVNLVTDNEGGRLKAGVNYDYDFAEQAFRASPGGQFNESHIKMLRFASVKEPSFLQRIENIEQLLPPSVWLLRQHS